MHLVQFYSEDRFVLDTMAQFLGGALARGGAAIAVATREHRAGLDERLRERGLDLELCISKGRYISKDASETLASFMVDGHPDPTRFAIMLGNLLVNAKANSQGNIAIFGEMVAVLWAQGQSEAAIQLEKLWNEMAKTHLFSLRCAYPLNVFAGEADMQSVLRICGEHTHVIPPEEYTRHELHGAIAAVRRCA
jgi:hypothetical protein